MVNPAWSYLLGLLGITGLLIVATRQWGFMATAVVYTVAYVRLLRRAYATPEVVEGRP